MADEPDTNAAYRILIPEDTSDDEVQIEVTYRDIAIRAKWRDANRQDLVDLLKQAQWFIDRAHLEYEVRRQAAQIDGDLNNLFPDDLEGEQ